MADMRKIIRALAMPRQRMPVVALFCLGALLGEAALGAEPKVAVVVGRSGEAFIIDATVDVEVPLTIAWEVLTDFDHMTSILGNLTSSKVTSRDGNIWIVRQEGVARYGLLSFSFESEREIRLEPMKRILARSLSGTLKRMDSEARIAALDQGVQIKYHAESVSDSVLARMFGASFVRHEVEQQFVGMGKEMLRRHARAEPAGKALPLPVLGVEAAPVSAGTQTPP
jgi:uncharacterized membrane protein